MENADHGSNHSKRSHRRGSNSHLSMSDTDSTASQVDSWHSPLRSESPFRSEDPYFQQENDNSTNKSLKSLVSVDKYYPPVPSPGDSNFQASSPASGRMGWRPWPHSEKPTSKNHGFPASYPVSGVKDGRREKPMSENHEFPAKEGSPVVLGLNMLVREEPPPAVKKMGAVHGGGGRLEEGYISGGGGEDEVGGERRSRAAIASILRRSERSAAARKVALVFRMLEVILCLVSFSIMAADKTKGWSGDSFDRYKEYRGCRDDLMVNDERISGAFGLDHLRSMISNAFTLVWYCLVVNIIGFVYSGFQAFDLAYSFGSENHVFSHHTRYQFDFSMDQILAYLLISASSSAATRTDDWISNWGKDQFTLMASASISVSFLAFTAFALSSLISGSNLCNRDTT